jgi:hypothetical protein
MVGSLRNEGALVAYFKLTYQHLRGGTDETMNKSLRVAVFGPKFECWTAVLTTRFLLRCFKIQAAVIRLGNLDEEVEVKR